MKYLFSIIILSFMACKSQNNAGTKTIAIKEKKQVVWHKNTENESYQTVEKISFIPNSIITLEHNEAGKSYVKILPGDKNIFQYAYHKKLTDSNIQDAFVNENIYFEWQGDLQNTLLTDAKLSEVKLTASFAGFRNSDAIAVTKGKLKVDIVNEHQAKIYIKIDKNKLPLPVTEINEIISIK